MEAQSPEPARIRNISIVSLSEGDRSRSIAVALQDELRETADTETDACAQGVGVPVSFGSMEGQSDAVLGESGQPINDRSARLLDTGSHGNSICSFSITHGKGPPQVKAEEEESQDGSLLVNLVTCLGHHASPNTAAAVRVTDAILMALDVDGYISSPPSFSNTLQLAVREACKPIIFFDKLDSVLFSNNGNLPPEDLYQTFHQIIDTTNAIIAECPGKRPDLDLQVDPRQETVLFGSTAGRWGFAITSFADLYAAKFGVARDKMAKRLWGGSYFDSSNKKWTTRSNADTQSLKRAFNQFILEPIFKVYSTVSTAVTDRKPLTTLLGRLDIKLSAEDEPKQGQELFNAIMRTWFPLGDTLKNVVGLMPSPLEAQKYRTAGLYGGPLDDELGVGMAECDPEAPLVIYIPHLIPTADSRDQLLAFGRVFSGKVFPGQKLRIHGPGHRHGGKTELYVKPVGDVFEIARGRSNMILPVTEASAGSLILLSGLEGFIRRSATISTSQQTHNIRDMDFSSPTTVQYDVQTKNPKKLPGLVSALTSMCKTDLSLETFTALSGQNFIYGRDIRRVEASFETLRALSDDPLVITGPFPAYRETVTAESSQVALSKSPNKHNRFWVSAEPLSEAFTSAIEAGVVHPLQEYKKRAAMVSRDYAWDEMDARKIWTFGPDGKGPNVVVDQTKAVWYLHEVKDSFVSGFQWASREGPLADEPMRSVRVNIVDVAMLSDAIHRGGGQIIPTARRVSYASMLLAQPRLMEPNCLVYVQTLEQHVTKVRKAIKRHGGTLCEPDRQQLNLSARIWGDPVVQAHLPTVAAPGLESLLRQDPAMSEHVAVQWVHAGWREMGQGDPLDEASEAGKLLLAVRERKGLSPKVDINNYLDKL